MGRTSQVLDSFVLLCSFQVGRDFSPNVHNPLQGMVIDRIKYQLGYPESAKDMIAAKSLLTAVEQYSMGTERPLSEYMDIVGLNMMTKEITLTKWCREGVVSFVSIVSRTMSCPRKNILVASNEDKVFSHPFYLFSNLQFVVSILPQPPPGFEQFGHLY